MTMEDMLLKNEERAILSLRSLYRSYGYLPYKMSKFEEYDLYVRNKDFLVSDRIITFNDTSGRLMALKPDVTLSIIKNGEDETGVKQKVCYNENVYRVSDSTHQYKEIMQAGLECVGDIDSYDVFEAVLLAAKSLSLISEDFVLDVGHLGILEALLEDAGADKRARREIAACVASRSRHGLEETCRAYGISEDSVNRLCDFVGIYGEMQSVIERLEPLCESEGARVALEELKELASLLSATPLASRIRFDFSIVNDMSYYNGIVFRGFLSGISSGILSGGRYDKLLHRMGRRAGAVGFAIYLDLLEGTESAGEGYDVDVLLLSGEDTPRALLAETVERLTAAGKRVSVQKAIPKKLRYRELMDCRGGKLV